MYNTFNSAADQDKAESNSAVNQELVSDRRHEAGKQIIPTTNNNNKGVLPTRKRRQKRTTGMNIFSFFMKKSSEPGSGSEATSLSEDGIEEDPETGSSMAAICFNFVNSILGSGLIGMPYVLQLAGLWMGILLFGVVGFAADYSVLLLIKAGQMSGTRSYQDLMMSVFGKPGFYIVTVLQFLLPFLTTVSYNVVVGDAITKVLLRLAGESIAHSLFGHREIIILIVTLTVTLPLSLYRDIGKLGKWSGLSVLFTIVNIAIVYFRSLTSPYVKASPDAYDVAHSEVPQALGILGIGIICHHNSFTLFCALSRPTMKRWRKVTHISVTSATCVMLAFSLGGYLTFTGYTEGDILENFCSWDDLGNLARLAFCVIVLMTYPLDLFVARQVLQRAISGDNKSRETTLWYHVGLTLLLITVITLVSMATDCVGIVMEINGILVGSPLAFFIPAVCVIKLRNHRILSRTNIGPLLLMVLSIVLSVTGSVTVVMVIYNGVTCSHGEEMAYCHLGQSAAMNQSSSIHSSRR